MRHLLPVPAMRPPGSPRRGVPGRLEYREPRGSAPRERDHRGGDHPVPSRTRQLSPPSPRVLQREAAGGQGVALAEGAFLWRRERPAGGGSPCGPLRVLGRRPPHPTSSEVAPFRLAVIAATMWRARRRAAEGPPQRLFFASRVAIDLTVPAALRRHRACRGTLLQAFLLADAASCCDSRCMRSVKSSLA